MQPAVLLGRKKMDNEPLCWMANRIKRREVKVCMHAKSCYRGVKIY